LTEKGKTKKLSSTEEIRRKQLALAIHRRYMILKQKRQKKCCKTMSAEKEASSARRMKKDRIKEKKFKASKKRKHFNKPNYEFYKCRQ
jgi:hypothetical protein